MKKIRILRDTNIGRNWFVRGDVLLVKDAESYGNLEWEVTLVNDEVVKGISWFDLELIV